jgi:hypothetical protein
MSGTRTYEGLSVGRSQAEALTQQLGWSQQAQHTAVENVGVPNEQGVCMSAELAILRTRPGDDRTELCSYGRS